MRSSEKIDQVATSLYAAQRELKNPATDKKADVKTKSGAGYSYPYLSLPALIEHSRTALDPVSLAITQEITRVDGGIGVTTLIMHSSGQWIELGPLFLPVSGGPQDFGSAITYGRRYALAAALGIAAEEDDDAASVKVEPAAKGQRSQESTAGGKAATEGPGPQSPGPHPGSSVHGEGAGGQGAREGGPLQPGHAEEAETPSLAITPEQLNVLLTEAGGIRKAKAAALEMFSKEHTQLTANEALTLIQMLQKANAA